MWQTSEGGKKEAEDEEKEENLTGGCEALVTLMLGPDGRLRGASLSNVITDVCWH